MKRILVTGGAGFIGSHLCERLLKEGNDVICLDNYFTGSKENIAHLLSNPYFELVRHDVTSPYYAEVDEIYNLACPASPVHYQYNPIKTVKTSVMGAINMLGLAKRVRAKILQASTSEVHGDGCDSVYQADAGVENADIFVATTGSDDVNLISCEIAKLVFGVPRTIARVNSPKNERIFRRMGIEAVSSTMVITRLIESEAMAGAVHAVMSLTQGDLVLTEVNIPNPDALVNPTAAKLEGRRVADITLPDGSLLVAVGRGDSLEIVKGATILYPGDQVIVVHKEGLENEVKSVLRSIR